MLKLYNTLTRQKEEFKAIDDKKVRLYTCGPTVYDYDHLGHAWTYFNPDILRRVLEYNGYNVKHVMNITDVGHLTGDNQGDADTGEDRLEKGARREGKSPWKIAEFYTQIFMENRKKMNLLKPHIVCKATDHIQEMIELNKKLLDKGFAYEAQDALYFDITQFSKYGQLSGNTLEQLKAGARIQVNPNKKNPFDFALWMKAVGRHTNHVMLWDSPWDRGFPGWHIECSAMSMKYLGDTLDIHTGGEDNIFPHHECEIAQSESASGKKFVNLWMHTQFLMVEGRRMGKSVGNFLRIQDLEAKDFSPLSLRYLFLTAHHRSQLNFTRKSLEAARNGLNNLCREIRKLGIGQLGKVDDNYKESFVEHINDDLDIPQALALTWDLLKSDLPNEDKLATVLDFDKIFGLKLDEVKQEEIVISEEVKKIAQERWQAKQNKDFVKADVLREKIRQMGFAVEDTEKGFKIKTA